MSEHIQHLVELLLPEGLLSYFDITSVTKNKEGQVSIHLEERNEPPDEFRGRVLHSKGLLPAIEVQDFPLRGKKCYLHISRRRWQAQDTGDLVMRDWKLVQSGTRMTAEFAAFLKGVFG
jgi:hypothetical protein